MLVDLLRAVDHNVVRLEVFDVGLIDRQISHLLQIHVDSFALHLLVGILMFQRRVDFAGLVCSNEDSMIVLVRRSQVGTEVDVCISIRAGCQRVLNVRGVTRCLIPGLFRLPSLILLASLRAENRQGLNLSVDLGSNLVICRLDDILSNHTLLFLVFRVFGSGALLGDVDLDHLDLTALVEIIRHLFALCRVHGVVLVGLLASRFDIFLRLIALVHKISVTDF